MRIKINFTKNTEDVPNNNSVILSYLHRCLGHNNEYHDKVNDYNVSNLYGGGLCNNPKYLTFSDGGYFVFSSLNTELINKLLVGLLNNPMIGYGMRFSNIDHISESFCNGWNHFATLSPFLIYRSIEKKKRIFITLEGVYKLIDGKYQITPDDNYNFEQVVKEYLINKLKKIDSSFDLSGFDLKIPKMGKNGIEHKGHKAKKVLVNNVVMWGNQCQISIFCNKKVAELLYNIGIGQSTGSGFGVIYKTENRSTYVKTVKKLEIKKTKFLEEVL